jgi:hypothetical protein
MTNLYAIVPLPEPGLAREALLRDAIAYGGGDELLWKFFACEATERDLANQQAQTAEVANRVADIGVHFMDQVEALTVRADKQARLDAKRKADKARRDAEEAAREEARGIRDWLTANPEPGTAPKPDDGELEIKRPPDTEHLDPEGSEDDAGAVPLSYGPNPESYIRSEAEGEPGIGGSAYPTPDPKDLGGPKDPKQVPQPVSASFW